MDIEDNKIQKIIDFVISKSEVYLFSNIVFNIDAWVLIIKQNLLDLDSETIKYLQKLKDIGKLNSYLRNKAENIKVVLVDKSLLISAREKGCFFNGNIPRAMGIGNYILLNKSLNMDFNPGNISISEASIIGHETIHNIQTDVYGGMSKFKSVYVNQKVISGGEYKNNPLELAAYRFGGSRVDYKINHIPHFKNYKEWWKNK